MNVAAAQIPTAGWTQTVTLQLARELRASMVSRCACHSCLEHANVALPFRAAATPQESPDRP